MAIIPRNPTTDFASTTLNGNVDESVLTITVNNAGTIQTPTYAVIDRLDLNSVLTPNAREVVYISSKSGNDLTVTRGVNNSTARAHNSGAILEPILSVGQWADLYTALDNEHNVADGSHDITKIVMVSGATIQTLANKILSNPTISNGFSNVFQISSATITDLKITNSAFASGASLVGFFPSGASGGVLTSIGNSSPPVFAPTVSTSLSSKVITGTRDLSAATGNVAYSGVGFQPTSIICFAVVDSLDYQVSWGFADSSGAGENVTKDSATTFRNLGSVLVFIQTAGGSFQSATVQSYGADGFTLAWSKTGTPTGTLKLMFMCFR